VREQMSSSIAALGHRVLRYGLAFVIAWIGGMKFTAYDAQGIAPLVATSPFVSRVHCPAVFRRFGSCRDLQRGSNSSSPIIKAGMRDRQCRCQPHVPHYALLLIFNAWMGTEPRWLSFSFGSGWAIPTQGCGSAWAAIWSLGESLSER
jgi:hypothetical protein